MISARHGAATGDLSPPPLSTRANRSGPVPVPGPGAGGISANAALYEQSLARRMRRVEWELEGGGGGGKDGGSDVPLFVSNGRTLPAAAAARDGSGAYGGAGEARVVAWGPNDVWASSGPRRVGLVSGSGQGVSAAS